MTEPPIAPPPALPTPPTAHRPAPLPRPTVPVPVPAQADNDEHLLALWLHGRSAATQRAYAADLAAFLAHVGRPLQAVTLGDVQAFQDTLATLAPATEARRLSAVKSLLSFGHKTGYLAVNVGAAIRLPPVKQTLAERILDVDAVLHMLALERHGRKRRCCGCSTSAACASAKPVGCGGATWRFATTPARLPCSARAAKPGRCC